MRDIPASSKKGESRGGGINMGRKTTNIRIIKMTSIIKETAAKIVNFKEKRKIARRNKARVSGTSTSVTIMVGEKQ